MRTKFTSFLVLAFLFSCEKKEVITPDYVILSGNFKNSTEDKISVRGINFNEKISLNKEGNFLDTLAIDYEGTYSIAGQEIYLQKGSSVTIHADFNELHNIRYTGDLATENNYLAAKNKISSAVLGENRREVYSLEENAFLQKIDEVVEKQTKLSKDTEFSVVAFKNLEQKSILYEKDTYINRYESAHGYSIGNREFKVSGTFPKLSVTDYDNAEELNFSTAYRKLVLDEFERIVAEITRQIPMEESTIEARFQTRIDNLKTFKSNNIRTLIASTFLVHYMSPGSDYLDFVYNEIVSNVADEKFKKDITERYNKMKALVKGSPSPKFDFENYAGGKTSLDDLKGKFVYIDVWATWCGPCKKEIPYLKEVEKRYHGKNIEFVSISIDRKSDYEKWKDFIAKEELTGIQLFADKEMETQFVQDYEIKGIPRFILIDTKGNIISADAPRPSNPKLIEMFTELGI